MAAVETELQVSDTIELRHPSDETKHRIVSALLNTTIQTDCFEPYFAFYTEQCEAALNDRGRHVSVRTFQGILGIANRLQDAQTTREDLVRSVLTASSATTNCDLDTRKRQVRSSVDLVARLLTMIHFGKLEKNFGPASCEWRTGSLKEFIIQYFAEQKLAGEHVKLEKVFNLYSIEHMAGIKIRWTSNLVDHLCLVDDDSVLLFYHHATFLEKNKNGVLPDKLVTETLQTMSLMLPRKNKAVRRWYQKQQRSYHLDETAIRCLHLNSDARHINNFHFWRDRLVILKQAFDEAEPRTLSQWWYDRRKGPQWYTFWVAVVVLVLTIFYGTVQSVEGALQVYKAYHPEK